MPSSAPRRLAVAALAACSLAVIAAPAGAHATHAKAKTTSTVPKIKNPVKEGTKLATKFFTLLKGTATPELKAFLSPSFIIQRADGTSSTKAEYLAGVVTNVKTFSFTDVKATVEGDTIVVRYTATTDQIVNGVEYKKTPAPRLSVFRWSGKAWRLLAHANFNTPVA